MLAGAQMVQDCRNLPSLLRKIEIECTRRFTVYSQRSPSAVWINQAVQCHAVASESEGQTVPLLRTLQVSAACGIRISLRAPGALSCDRAVGVKETFRECSG